MTKKWYLFICPPSVLDKAYTFYIVISHQIPVCIAGHNEIIIFKEEINKIKNGIKWNILHSDSYRYIYSA